MINVADSQYGSQAAIVCTPAPPREHIETLSDFESALRALQETYLRTLPDKIGELATMWRAYSDEPRARDQFTTFVRIAHGLAGSGATYGYPQISRAAKALEVYAKSIQTITAPTAHQRQEIENYLAQLAQAIPHERAAPLPLSIPKTESFTCDTVHGPTVWLFEPDDELASEIESELVYYGYRIQPLSNGQRLVVSTIKSAPAALIVDWDAARLGASFDKWLPLINLHADVPGLPIVFLSSQDELAVRLDAVRHGATAFVVKPFAMTTLLETVDAQTGKHNSDPFRVLILEDDLSVASYSATNLEQAGMVTHIVTDPLHVMPALIEFHPDLILSDVYMPNIGGVELAAVLRQQEAYLSIPIVFLSSESDTDKQLSAMLHGGDDFLQKPIEPRHLISKVTSRIRRARMLRSLAERDGLTGLLNHTRLKEQLAIQVARANRTGAALSFAMLDLDHFKGVNDSFGHLRGDRVLKSVARFVTQRLRQSDIVGRYGGEEIAVILPETDGQDAYLLIEEIRDAFSRMLHSVDETEFTVTFSAGVATLSLHDDAISLNQAADRALYQAKCNGRNRVVY